LNAVGARGANGLTNSFGKSYSTAHKKAASMGGFFALKHQAKGLSFNY
jgi:hypothetical protein